jgi:hypothetical protein
MTLHRSQPQTIGAFVPGDMVRIVSPGASSDGSTQAGLIRMISTGAFGKIVSDGNSNLAVELHELMPAEIRAFGKIGTVASTMVERLHVDNDGDIALIAFEYLHGMAAKLRGAVGDIGRRDVMMAALKADADRILAVLQANGYAVVEQVSRELKTTKKLVITQQPEEARLALREGRVSHAATKIFDLSPVLQKASSESVSSIAAALEALFEKSHAGQPPAPTMTPFMQALAGQQPDTVLSPNDLMGDLDQDEFPAPVM